MSKKKPQKDNLIHDIISDLNKSNPETAMVLEDAVGAKISTFIPSGDPGIDEILGGGWPCGRVVEVYGAESHGKTTLALHAIAEAQKMDGITIFLDTEHALNMDRAKSIGIDLKKMIYAQPATMEEVFKYAEKIIDKVREHDTDRPVIIVWDSVAATPTKSEVDGDYGDHNVGVHGRVMSQGLRKITSKISKQNILFLCVNQVRDKVGVVWGEKTTTPGGRALKFYSSIRVEIARTGQYKEGNNVVGISCVATVKKNKIAPPFGKAEFNILFEEENGGIDTIGSVLDAGYDMGILGNSRGWYEIDGKKYRKIEARTFLRKNPKILEELRNKIKKAK